MKSFLAKDIPDTVLALVGLQLALFYQPILRLLLNCANEDAFIQDCHGREFAVELIKKTKIAMRVLVIQNCQTETIGFYEDYLRQHQIPFDTFPAYLNQELPSPSIYDFFIIGGTPISVSKLNKYNFLSQERKYLEKVIVSDKFCLGICFGGQLLANILGADVRKNPVPEIGIYEVELTLQGKKDPCWEGFPEFFPVFQWHNDTFDLPSGAKLLVKGEICLNQAFRLKNVMGLQFHLEIGSTQALDWAVKYKQELRQVAKTKKQIGDEYRLHQSEMKKLAFRLMDNIFAFLAKKKVSV